MQINKEADFVLKGNKVIHPPVRTDGLELYYDTKGKKNTDTYKNRMLDMSGNDRHGELQNFNYKNLSGYQEDSELVFDGIEDKLVLPDIGEPEIVSATKNLVDINNVVPKMLDSWSYGASTISISGNSVTFTTTSNYTGVMFPLKLKPNTTYTAKVEGTGLRIWVKPRRGTENISEGISGNFSPSIARTFTTTSYSEYWLVIDQGATGAGTHTLTEPQLEEGSAATPYVPYIPSIKGTYQINNNIISYNGDTVRWVKDGKVMERKGINLIRNGNFFDGNRGWSVYGTQTGDSKREIVNGFASIKREPNQSGGFGYVFRGIPTKLGDKLYFSGETNVISGISGIDITNQHPIVRTRPDHSKTGVWQKNSDIAVADSRGSTDIILNVTSDTIGGEVREGKFRNIQFINLTDTFGAGNEPTLEEIQAESDKWQWLPNPLDLVEAEELKGNILGDMEDTIDDHTRDEQSGIEVFTDKADDSLVRVEVDGKSYQYAGSGKNLFYSIYSHHSNAGYNSSGWTSAIAKIEPNKTYTVSYTVTDSTRFSLWQDTLSSGIKADRDDKTSNSYRTTTRGEVIEETITTNEEGGYLVIYLHNAKNNVKENIQIEEGSTATTYEPPAQTPDYPVEIHSLNDFDVVSQKSEGGRNLIPSSLFDRNTDGSGLKREFNQNGTIVFDGQSSLRFDANIITGARIYLKKGQTYTFSIDHLNGSVSTTQYLFLSFRNNEDILQVNYIRTNLEAGKVTFTADEDGHIYRIRLIALEGVLHDNYTFRVKLEKGNKATNWTPAPEDITENDNHPLINKINFLLSEPLRSVGDVKDRLFRDNDGVWKIERNIHELILDGSEAWTTYLNATYNPYGKVAFRLVQSLPENRNKTILGNNSHFNQGKDLWRMNATGNITGTTNYSEPSWTHMNLYIVTLPSVASTPSEFNSFLAREMNKGNPVIHQYAVENPTIETLDREFQEKLNNLRSFQDSSYIYTIINEAGDLPSHISENLKPTIHTEFLAKDHFKESRTVNNLLIWNRSLEDEELLNQNKLFHERFNMRSNTIKGEPITQTINLTQGGYAANTLSLEYTIEI